MAVDPIGAVIEGVGVGLGVLGNLSAAAAAKRAAAVTAGARGEQLPTDATRKLGVLQARNTRQVGHAEANNARVTGNAIASAHQWGAASTIATGAADVYRVSKYGR